ncbi:hypothetical protein BDN70DRAFT_809626 [Pholiota conissans]|uniref:Uncharacterized protein n=1 Tax=Pholiota conissans TaxID=109636 RepID=A0A9P5YZN8_9AGAR|nr:hypothetical protein BDN70DRAFT_809626 [Pholiota conissans]
MAVFSSGEISPALSPRSNCQTQPITPSSFSFPRKADATVPKPLRSEESPEAYLMRLKSAVGKAEVAGVLASSSDSFYAEALRAYIKQFEFHDIPLDVALRKLLMEVGLPRETQQIDRVMEAFASRYMFCNPGIFTSEDHPYILAFSLIMLHTDAFNPSNKRKMTKADYIKNTKLPGIYIEVLDCFFDNIVFAPFIFIEDPLDSNGQSSLVDGMRTLAANTPTSALSSSAVPGTFKMGNKVDPYYLITNDLLEPLRVDINSRVPLKNPFTFEGTSGPWDEQELHEAFLKANIIHIGLPSVQRTPTMFGLHSGGTPSVPNDINSVNESQPQVETWTLKVAKVGLLNRKDDIVEGGKKSSNRKWKTWSVILTGSQLLFFRDPTWANSLLRSSDNLPDSKATRVPTLNFRPDESFSVKDAIAVFDRSYTKYKHTLRFVLPDGRQSLFQAADDADMNSWISRINYASSFKSTGVRMRPLGLSGEDVLLTGVAAATSHLHDMQKRSELRRHRSWDSNVAHDLMNMLSSSTEGKRPLRKRRITMSGRADLEMDVPIAPEVDGAEQFKATFDQVKADLAASSWSSLDDSWLSQEEDIDVHIYDSPLTSPGSSARNSSELPSRSQIIQSKIRDIDSKLHATQPQYDADMIYIHNIAILTPFQKSTRSRLSAAIQSVAKRVSQVRLDMERLKCHRHVLVYDLASEGRSWSQSKQIALRAAKQTLKSHHSQALPTMTLSMSNDSAADFSQFPHTPLSRRPESSISESFHSTTDFRATWASSEDVTFLSATNSDSQKSSSPESTSCPPIPHDLRRSLSSSINSNIHIPASSQGDHQHDQHDTASQGTGHNDNIEEEEAEEWNRTRCAQRVSLIHVPSSIMISPWMRSSVGPGPT